MYILITVNAVKYRKKYKNLFLMYLIMVLQPKVSRNFYFWWNLLIFPFYDLISVSGWRNLLY